MRNKKSTIIIFVIVILYWVLDDHLSSESIRQRNIENYTKIKNASLNGNLEWIQIRLHGRHFKLDNDTTEYLFYPITSWLNNNKDFIETANIGDMIYKESGSKVLLLIHDGDTLRYNFRKIFEDF